MVLSVQLMFSHEAFMCSTYRFTQAHSAPGSGWSPEGEGVSRSTRPFTSRRNYLCIQILSSMHLRMRKYAARTHTYSGQ